MRVKEIMTADVECLPQDASLVDAAEKMRDCDIGSIPVCEGEKCVGMLTDRDITIRAAAEGKDFRSTKVRDVMSPDVAFCFDDQDVKEAEKTMEERQVRRLIVLDRKRRLCGVLSIGDLSGADKSLAGQVIEKVTEPIHAKR